MGKLCIFEDAFCEHCGNLEPFELMWRDDCDWCIDCATCGDFDFDYTDKEVAEWQEKSRKKQLAYHEKIVKALKR